MNCLHLMIGFIRVCHSDGCHSQKYMINNNNQSNIMPFENPVFFFKPLNTYPKWKSVIGYCVLHVFIAKDLMEFFVGLFFSHVTFPRAFLL